MNLKSVLCLDHKLKAHWMLLLLFLLYILIWKGTWSRPSPWEVAYSNFLLSISTYRTWTLLQYLASVCLQLYTSFYSLHHVINYKIIIIMVGICIFWLLMTKAQICLEKPKFVNIANIDLSYKSMQTEWLWTAF